MPYTQLTQEQRYAIYSLMKERFSKSSISDVIGVHRSTVYRELARNTGQRGYRYKQAHRLTEKRRLNSQLPVRFTEAVQEIVVFISSIYLLDKFEITVYAARRVS